MEHGRKTRSSSLSLSLSSFAEFLRSHPVGLTDSRKRGQVKRNSDEYWQTNMDQGGLLLPAVKFNYKLNGPSLLVWFTILLFLLSVFNFGSRSFHVARFASQANPLVGS